MGARLREASDLKRRSGFEPIAPRSGAGAGAADGASSEAWGSAAAALAAFFVAGFLAVAFFAARFRGVAVTALGAGFSRSSGVEY